MKKKMIGEVPGNVLGMMADLAHKLQHGKITPQELGRFLKRENLFEKLKDLTSQIAEWEVFYQEVFDREVDFSNLELPEKAEGFNWLIVRPEGMTPNKLFDKCKERFPSWRYTEDLDVIESVRKADKTYAIWVRDRIEADKENKNKSVNDCDKKGIKGITLEERLLLELFYNWRTGKHLDIDNTTLCSGSRNPHGRVPSVDWSDGKLRVDDYSPAYAYEYLHVRAAVS